MVEIIKAVLFFPFLGLSLSLKSAMDNTIAISQNTYKTSTRIPTNLTVMDHSIHICCCSCRRMELFPSLSLFESMFFPQPSFQAIRLCLFSRVSSNGKFVACRGCRWLAVLSSCNHLFVEKVMLSSKRK